MMSMHADPDFSLYAPQGVQLLPNYIAMEHVHYKYKYKEPYQYREFFRVAQDMASYIHGNYSHKNLCGFCT